MLAHFLTTGVFAYLVIFCRVGSGIMMMVGTGETLLPARVRLIFALAFAALLLPVLQPVFPPLPSSPSALALLVIKEILIGLYLGLTTRVIIAAAHTAGTIIATQTGLASAMLLDFTQTTQSTVITNLLSLMAVVLFFLTDLHHVALRGLAASYSVFAPGSFPALADLAQQFSLLVTRSFNIAAHLAAPHIVIGLITYLGAGVLARLMPTMQIFFVLMAPQILLGIFILMVILPSMMLWLMTQMEDGIITALPYAAVY